MSEAELMKRLREFVDGTRGPYTDIACDIGRICDNLEAAKRELAETHDACRPLLDKFRLRAVHILRGGNDEAHIQIIGPGFSFHVRIGDLRRAVQSLGMEP